MIGLLLLTGYSIDAVGMMLVTKRVSNNIVIRYSWKNMAISFRPINKVLNNGKLPRHRLYCLILFYLRRYISI